MLELDKQTVKQLAMSRNHQAAGDEKEAYMSIAYTEVKLGEDQVDGLMGKYTWRSWFNVNGKDIQPMEWTKKVELKCVDAFKDVSVAMVLGKVELEFEGCRLYIDRFKLLSGGDVMTDLHIHVLKAKDSEWNLIGQHEFTEVSLSLGDGVVIERKSRMQRELPLEADPQAEPAEPAPSPNGSHLPTAAGSGGESSPAAADPLVYAQHGESGEKWKGLRSALPVGYVEVDPPDDSADFEAGVAKALGASKKRGSNVIDGRSERVKHQDRQRDRGDAH